MSLNSILSIARSALAMQQRSVDVTSHNIANAGTEGYRRQRLDLTEMEPLRTPEGTVGRGVTAAGISRARDQFLDTSFRQENGRLGRFNTTNQLLSGVEDIFDDSTGSGLGAGLDALLSAFGDLANDPSSASARGLVVQSAQSLTQQFHAVADRVATVNADLLERMKGDVSDVNNIGAQIANLNRQIVSAAKGVSAPDLEDQRDLLIDQLSQKADVQVVEHPDHGVTVVAGGALLVDGAQHGELEVQALATGGYGLASKASHQLVTLSSGSLKALSDLSSSTLPGIQKQLDQFATAVVQEVNAVHQSGTTTSGASGTDFFNAAGTTASSIELAVPIKQSPSNIAAGVTGTPGDGSVALKLAQLRTTPVDAAGGQTLGEFYGGVVTSIATLTQSAAQGSTSQDALVANVQAQRSSATEVSIDEEMVSLIKGQQAFAAASKIVNAADEMMQSILDMV
jgi:flagellar hook-associated protein 1 FlgK